MNRKEKMILCETQSIIRSLEEEACEMVDNYMRIYRRRQLRKEFGDNPGLFPCIRKKKDGFEINWKRTIELIQKRWGWWDCIRKDLPISKGRGCRYSLDQYANQWEIESINQFEDQAERIRENVQKCIKIITQIKRLDNAKS